MLEKPGVNKCARDGERVNFLQPRSNWPRARYSRLARIWRWSRGGNRQDRDAVDDGGRRFGSNVECRTAHSLAFRAVGRRYRERLSTQARLPAKQTAHMLGITRDLAVGRHSVKVTTRLGWLWE